MIRNHKYSDSSSKPELTSLERYYKTIPNIWNRVYFCCTIDVFVKRAQTRLEMHLDPTIHWVGTSNNMSPNCLIDTLRGVEFGGRIATRISGLVIPVFSMALVPATTICLKSLGQWAFIRLSCTTELVEHTRPIFPWQLPNKKAGCVSTRIPGKREPQAFSHTHMQIHPPSLIIHDSNDDAKSLTCWVSMSAKEMILQALILLGSTNLRLSRLHLPLLGYF